MKRIHLVIHGRVQGVFFRVSAIEQAQRLGLSGWVRNTDDGAVEIVAEGEESALQALRKWSRQGPPSAHVQQVEDIKEDATGEFRGFHARP